MALGNAALKGLRRMLGKREAGPRSYAKTLLYESDPTFRPLYEAGLERTGTPDNRKRPARFYNLVQFLDQALDAAAAGADWAECGCYRGLSSYLMLHWTRRRDPGFDGKGFHVFDSFQGLSRPQEEDRICEPSMVRKVSTFAEEAGAYRASTEEVRQALADFPNVAYHEGWIPEVFTGLQDRTYCFVHLDLDLYRPTLGALEYFYPRLAPDGILVLDEYGSLKWPGAKKAADEFCAAAGVRPLALSSGQAVLWR